MNKESRKGIVIVSSESTKDFLRDCILSCVNLKYPVLVVFNGGYKPEMFLSTLGGTIEYAFNDWNGFELGGIEQGMERFDEFILLQDTVIIKDQSMFDICFDFEGSVFFTDQGLYHYGAKFRTELLKFVGVPRVESRLQAIHHEWYWGHMYFMTEKNKKYLPEIMDYGNDSYPKVERHSRVGILLENRFMQKHKVNYKNI